MGLDQYLYAEVYLSGSEYASDPDERERFGKIAAITGITPTAASPGFLVAATVAYWRKANQVHRWFVQNVQEEADDCQRALVSREQLVQLRDLCQTVLENRDEAEELLPVQSGFFFGNYEYDEFYFDQVAETVDSLTEILAKFPENARVDFYYQSSW